MNRIQLEISAVFHLYCLYKRVSTINHFLKELQENPSQISPAKIAVTIFHALLKKTFAAPYPPTVVASFSFQRRNFITQS